LGSAGESFTTYKAFNVLWVVAILRPVDFFCWDQIQNSLCKKIT